MRRVIDRCTCIPHCQDSGAGLTEYVPEWDPSCSEHGEVDHILASGRYTDRRGREWAKVEPLIEWFCWEPVKMLQPGEVRLLIERDMHRDECGDLLWCDKHPVPAVIVCHEPGEAWGQFKVRAHGGATVFRAFPEAMDAARALAVEP